VRGFLFRLSALVLIAFVAISAQCVASCAAESCAKPAQPPCHQSPSRDSDADAACAPSLATGDSGSNAPAHFGLPAIERVDTTPVTAAVALSAPPPTPARPIAAPIVLRI
jgi:hypothetical protein